MMSCGCGKGKRAPQFVWTDGVNTIVYSNEVVAKAKVKRRGGTYTRKDPG